MNMRQIRQDSTRVISTTIKEEVMNRTMNIHMIMLSAVMGMVFLLSGIGQANTLSQGHRNVSGVVTAVKGEVVTVKTSTGTLSLTQKGAAEHGHAEYRNGDEVILMMDENNNIIEAHHKGEEGHHHFYTGKLIYMGKTKKEIKLETIDGEKVFPLGRLEIKTKPIEEGEIVTVEVNEGDIVIDLHRGAHGAVKH